MSNKHSFCIVVGLCSVPLGRFPLKQLDSGILRKHLLQSLPALGIWSIAQAPLQCDYLPFAGRLKGLKKLGSGISTRGKSVK